MASSEFFIEAIAFLLTLAVLFYLVGDNFLFRAAIYIFIGASAGYVTVLLLQEVFAPQKIIPIISGSGGGIALAILVLLLFAKAFPPLSKLGTPSLAFMVGVGAAIAIGGAVTGTLFPQTSAAINAFEGISLFEGEGGRLLEAILMLLVTISTLVYFQFSARRGDDGKYRRNPITRVLAFFGKIFIAITFGVLFAGVFSAALTAFIERVDSIINFIIKLRELF
ncbi:MAG: hypothetical protein HN390_03475 [Anaerolineae bacterium]|jgi:hypothetical protein|nr:hypothetical protein [Anaerolineae bacterium]MBT7989417.1 hypothetical protein [Anaerolineae bacterium]